MIVVDRTKAHSAIDDIFSKINADMFASDTFKQSYAVMNTVRTDVHSLVDKIYDDSMGDLSQVFDEAAWIVRGTTQS
jgi:hypothetical protein